jgi:hypothetical protein
MRPAPAPYVNPVDDNDSPLLFGPMHNKRAAATVSGCIFEDGLINSNSGCSIETEYGRYDDRMSDEARQDREVDDSCSVTEDGKARARDAGTASTRDGCTSETTRVNVDDRTEDASVGSRSKKSIERFKRAVEKIVKRDGPVPTMKQSRPRMMDRESTQTSPVSPSMPNQSAGKQKQKQRQKQKQTPLGVVKNSAEILCEGPSPNKDKWTGHVVGLRLPPNIDPEFDSKNKPTDRRVEPCDFLASIEVTNRFTRVEDDWSRWRKEADDTANISLDIRLSTNRGGDSQTDETARVRMTRDPGEAVSKTLQRLQLSVQKKVGGTRKKRGKGGKGADVDDSKRDNEAVLLKKKIQGGDEIHAAPPTSQENNEVMACIAFWGGFSDYILAINPCNSIRAEQSDKVADNDDGIMDGYELVEINSLTINEVLQQATTVAGLGRYAISVPIVFNDRTSRIPVMIESCPPTITRVSTFGSFDESHLFVETPIVVEVGLLYSTGARIAWFADREQVCADSPCYTPAESDVGKVLTVVVIPQRPDHDGRGCEEAYQFKRRVEKLPHLPIIRPLREEFMDRSSSQAPPRQWQHHDAMSQDDPTMSLRVVTYNILADQNLSRDVDKTDGTDRIYSHCKNEYLVKWRRHPLIVHEILQYQPDIIALQEVDTDVFADLIRPVLSAKGYEGYFSQKGADASSGMREGCAIFWSLSVFESVRPVDMRTRTFREMIQEFSCDDERMHRSQWKSLEDMSELLENHDRLKRVLFDKLGHIMQTVVLTQRQSQEKLLIGNTHLFYHPMASHIRCLKMLIASRQLEIEHEENGHCPIILCGDLNSQ